MNCTPPRLPPLYLMDAILVSEMGVAWVPSVFEDIDGVNANSTVTAKDANSGYNVRITSAPDVPDGMLDDGNWTMENVYWNLYGATGREGRAIMPYVLNFFAWDAIQLNFNTDLIDYSDTV